MPVTALHSQHCRECKLRIRELLAVLYGDCRVDHFFGWPSRPDAYAGSRLGTTLRCIYDALCRHRGYRDFIRAQAMPPCDYYVPRPGFIVELDEEQHFTRPRLAALRCYPAELSMGFDVRAWMRLCESLDREDPTPPDRDERRAWYDCLRDLLPPYYGLEPTVRLYAGALPWCAFRPDCPEDQRRFASMLGIRLR